MLSLDHLRTLSAFAKAGTMARAARELGISQPAVSMQLSALEASCPEPLFLMNGTRKVLSPFGHKLHEMSAPSILELVKKTSDFLQNPEETVLIAGRDHILEKITSSLKDLASSAEFLPCSSAVATRKISNLEVSFGISHEVPNSSSLIAKKLFVSRPAIAFSSKAFGSLQKKDINSLSSDDLIKNKILTYRRDDPALIQLCKMKDITLASLRFGLIAPNWTILRNAALNGQGLALLPLECINSKELSVIELVDRQITSFEYYLIYSKHTSQTSLGKKWIKLIGAIWSS